MLCSNTKDIPAIQRDKMMHVDMSVDEVLAVMPVVEKIREVVGNGHGSGEVTIPIKNGHTDRLHISIVDYPYVWQELKKRIKNVWRSFTNTSID